MQYAQNPTFQWAQFYANAWEAIPILLHYVERWYQVWDPDSQQHVNKPVCSCSRGANCSQPGKHPLVGWKQKPMSTPAEGLQTLTELLQSFPKAALALRTGSESGLCVVDIDIKPDKRGDISFLEGLAKYGINPDSVTSTLMQYTGGGGVHYIFRYPEDRVIPTITNHPIFGAGVDIKGAGGMFNVQPSLHKSGNYYQFASQPDYDRILDLPQMLIDRIAKSEDPYEINNITEAYTPDLDELRDLAASLKKRKASHARKTGKEFERALEGDAVFIDGAAHDGFRDIMFEIARKWPFCDTDTILECFRASVDARIREKNDASTDLTNLRDSLETAKEKTQKDFNSWSRALVRSENGAALACLMNYELILRNDMEIKDNLFYGTREKKPWLKAPIRGVDGDFPRALSQDDVSMVTMWIQKKHGIYTAKVADVSTVLNLVAKTDSVDTFTDWILRLPDWDGVPRLDTFMQHAAGVVDDEWVRTIFPIWFRGSVRRFIQPGYKQDTMLILEGDQGFQKSSFFKVLLPDDRLFSDSLQRLVLDEANLRLLHSGPAIFEISELAAFSRSSREDLKAFLSATFDSVRPLYGQSETHPRNFIVVGTTNSDTYLDDVTGNRRFLPMKVTRPIDLGCVALHRNQLYAEALWGLRQGMPDYVTVETFHYFRSVQEARVHSSAWTEIIREYLDRETPDPDSPGQMRRCNEIAMRTVLSNVLGIEDKDITRRKELDAADCLRQLGWRRHKSNGRIVWRRAE